MAKGQSSQLSFIKRNITRIYLVTSILEWKFRILELEDQISLKNCNV